MATDLQNFRWKCEWCKNYFDVPLLDIRRGRGRFCSKSCKKNYQHAHGGPGVNLVIKRKRDNALLNAACNGCEGDCVSCPLEDNIS